MVKLHVKHGDESQFLYETTANTPVDNLVTQISLIYNGRLKVHRICNGIKIPSFFSLFVLKNISFLLHLEMSMLAKYGITLSVNMQGLTDEQISDLKLVDEYADKCIPMDGYVEEDDVTGKRNGRGKNQIFTKISYHLLFFYFSSNRKNAFNIRTYNTRSKR